MKYGVVKSPLAYINQQVPMDRGALACWMAERNLQNISVYFIGWMYQFYLVDGVAKEK